jgi:WXXGXW repeat (2 copies)
MKPITKALMVTLYLGAGAFGPAAVLAGSGSEADAAPPPARDERPPAPRDGYVWAPGYWDWSGHAYSWMPGRFIFERRGAHWVADRWDPVGSHWQHVAGHWER